MSGAISKMAFSAVKNAISCRELATSEISEFESRDTERGINIVFLCTSVPPGTYFNTL